MATTTPRTDEAETWNNDAGPLVRRSFAEELELELSQLRASFERLAARWNNGVNKWSAGWNPGGDPVDKGYEDGHWGGIEDASDDIHRVLAGETPPEPGVEWPERTAPALTES